MQSHLLSFAGTTNKYRPYKYLPALDGGFTCDTQSFLASCVLRHEESNSLDITISTEDVHPDWTADQEAWSVVEVRGRASHDVTGSPEHTHLSDAHFYTPSVSFIEGPDVLGYEVHNKIGTGVLCCLQAILDGRYSLSFMGFSRGAVESIITAHEIQRIIDTLKESDDGASAGDLLGRITAALHPQTREYLNGKLSPWLIKSPGNFFSLRQKMQPDNIALHIFAIDPVPGGGIAGLGAWHDPRFYFLPRCVKTYTTVICEHERSFAFKPIIPDALYPNETKITRIKMPGAHGTAVGNHGLHSGAPPTRETTGDLKDAQIVTLFHLYDFLTTHGVHFMLCETACHLQSFFNNYHQATLSKKRALKKTHYAAIKVNLGWYQNLIHSWYVLGREKHIAYHLGYQDVRVVHYRNSQDTEISVVFPPNDTFVNAQEAENYLMDVLSIDESSSSLDHIESLLTHLGKDAGELQVTSAATQCLPPQNAPGSLLESSLQLMLGAIAQTYLNGEFDAHHRQKFVSIMQKMLVLQASEQPGAVEDSSSAAANTLPKIKKMIYTHAIKYFFDVIHGEVVSYEQVYRSYVQEQARDESREENIRSFCSIYRRMHVLSADVLKLKDNEQLAWLPADRVVLTGYIQQLSVQKKLFIFLLSTLLLEVPYASRASLWGDMPDEVQQLFDRFDAEALSKHRQTFDDSMRQVEQKHAATLSAQEEQFNSLRQQLDAQRRKHSERESVLRETVTKLQTSQEQFEVLTRQHNELKQNEKELTEEFSLQQNLLRSEIQAQACLLQSLRQQNDQALQQERSENKVANDSLNRRVQDLLVKSSELEHAHATLCQSNNDLLSEVSSVQAQLADVFAQHELLQKNNEGMTQQLFLQATEKEDRYRALLDATREKEALEHTHAEAIARHQAREDALQARVNELEAPILVVPNPGPLDAPEQDHQQERVELLQNTLLAQGLNFQIIGGFCAAIGCAAVALALTALYCASAMSLIGVSGGLVVPAALVVGGLFSTLGFWSCYHGTSVRSAVLNHALDVRVDI